jgi:hypothetical protein
MCCVLGSVAVAAAGASAQGVPSVVPSVSNPHPAFPWFYPTALATNEPTVRSFEVPPRVVTLPMTQPDFTPSTIMTQEVTLPGYRVTETAAGFIVHGHWGVQPTGAAYAWTWVPTYFKRK